MDPSQNNPPVNSYQPPQQNPPTQQNYPPVNPQNYPPQQYPASHQNYPPANPYKSLQQPQDANFLQDPKDENEFDQGWCKCYKVCLVILFLLSLWSYGIGFGHIMIIQLSVNVLAFRESAPLGVIYIIGGLCLMALVALQLLAIKEKALLKAKIALIGFICYVTVLFVGPLFIGIMIGDPSRLLGGAFINTVIYGSLSLIGSYKVYQTLNASNTDEIQNGNYQDSYTA